MKYKLSGFLAILLVSVTVLGVIPSLIKGQPALPAIWIQPATLSFNASSASVGDKFNVTVWAGTTIDVFTWQAEVMFNATQLVAMRAAYTGGATSQWFQGHAVIPVTILIDNTTGTVVGGESLLGADTVHASNGSLFWIEFQMLIAPAPGATLASLIDTNDPTNSYLLDTDLNTMGGVTLDHAAYSFSGPPPTKHQVVVNSVTPSSGQVNQGSVLSIGTVVLNNGTVTETFDVNATYDGTLIGKQTVASLAAGSTKTLTFNWNTTGVAVDNYTVTATATPVTGQTDLNSIFKTAMIQVLEARHQVDLSSVTLSSASVNQGASLSFSVVILNNGTVTETSIVANATANGTLIEQQTISSLGAGNTKTLTFNWSTVGVSVGSYTVTASLTPVPNQRDLSSISKSATVQVLEASAQQYYLTVTSPYGSPAPQSGWFDPETSITESVSSPVSGGLGIQYVCTGWTGTGSVPASGVSVSVTFAITANSTITWNWKTQYQVKFDQSGVASGFPGTVAEIDSVNYAVSDLPHSFWWDSGSSHDFSFASPLIVASTQYVWSSTVGLSSLQSGTLTITGPGSIIGNYSVQTSQPTQPVLPVWLLLASVFGLAILGASVLSVFLRILGKTKGDKYTQQASRLLQR
jgi:hypothetical protein